MAPKTGRAKRPTATNYLPIAAFLPLSHLRILDEEAKLLGVRRAKFLEMLLRRKRGELKLERHPGAPSYVIKRAELEETARFVWLASPEVRAMYEEENLRMGNLSAQAFIVVELNRWIGKIDGFQQGKDGRFR